jgi:hypothetical protein
MLDPLVSFTVYDIVKSIYSSNNNLEDIRNRTSAIQNTLSQLRVTNIATLDALTQHFGRLIDTTKADDEWISELAQNLSYCTLLNNFSNKGIARPRLENSVTQHDRHAHRLLIDLITHREKIFPDLKRQSVKKARPESLDESQRRVRYEARSRAVSAAARSPRIPPADQVNGSAEKTPSHTRRLSGIGGVTGVTGILGNRPPSLSLDPGDSLSLDGGLPAGGSDEPVAVDSAPVEVTVTDESANPTPTKKPSLGRSYPIRSSRPVGLQRHLKRESVAQDTAPVATEQDKDAVAVAANVRRSLEDKRPVGVTLRDGPARG